MNDVVDLSEFFGAERAALVPVLADAYTIEGRLLGWPYTLNAGILYYRRDLLETYGYSSPPRTWAELEQMATAIQAQERAAGHPDFWGYIWQGFPAEHLTCNALEWQHAEGGGMILDAALGVTVNNVQTVTALERARSWIGAISPPSVRIADEDSCAQEWRRGRAVFMRLWMTGYDIFNDPVMGDLTGITILPAGSVRHAATLGGWPLTVRAASNDIRTAVALIREITSAATQRERAMARHPHFPALRALYEEPVVNQRMPLSREILPLADAGGLAIRPAKTAGVRYPQVSSAYSTAVASVLYAGVDASAALAELEQTLVALLRGMPEHRSALSW